MRVGPFQLSKVLGRGGMGVVYEARHADQDTVAALKLDLHPPDPQWEEAFLNEVRLMAGLDHPNCVVVYDTGRVAPEEVRGLDPEVRPGSSWLAMELAPLGSLKETPPTNWDETRHVLSSLLQALAHAHSRGVVHRDIKPANLLLAPGEDRSVRGLRGMRIVLSDFGVGHGAAKPTWMDTESVGTPQYMSPEQIEAHWRDQGPWTDLYQVGVLVWRLVTGDYPFVAKNVIALYRAHLFQKPGAFRPAFPVPAGLEAWTRTLLAKDFRERTDLAARALAGLDALGAPVTPAARTLPAPGREEEDSSATQVTASPGRVSGSVRGTVLRGAGLGLWGLRRLPLIGRGPECHALGHALRQVELTGRARWVGISGPAGVGKTRLVEWLVESAHERGAARSWRATHSATGQDVDGVRGMLRRELRLVGLDAEELRARLERRFEDNWLAALIERWCADGADSGTSLVERAGAFDAALAVHSRDLPLIVWLEDAHLAEEALRFARFVLRRQATDPRPVLFVGTFRDDLLADRDGERALRDELAAGDATSIRLGALDEIEHQELVRRLLGLDRELAVDVERQTRGNPQFAVQLVNDWVERAVLVPGESGLRLRDGASRELPGDLVSAWQRRWERLLPNLRPAEITALELASAFGPTVDVALWADACARVGVTPGDALSTLVRGGLAASEVGGRTWSFGHELFRAAIREHAVAAGRAPAWAGVVADTLTDAGVRNEAVARLLLEAGRSEEAFEPLRWAANVQLDSGDMRTDRLLVELEGLLAAVGAGRHDARRAIVLMLRSWFCRMSGDTARGEQFAARALFIAEASGDPSARGWAFREAGVHARVQGELDDALEDFRQAEALLLQVGRTESAANCAIQMADLWFAKGEPDRAEPIYARTVGAFERPAAWVFSYEPHFGLARVAASRGDLDQAFVHLREARRLVARSGKRNDAIRIENFEGDLRRKSGDLVEAARSYQEAVSQAVALNLTHNELYGRLNMAILHVVAGELPLATVELDRIERRQQQSGHADPLLAGFVAAVRLPGLAVGGSVPALEEGIARVVTFSEETGVREPDVAAMCAAAAERTSDPRAVAALRELQRRHATKG